MGHLLVEGLVCKVTVCAKVYSWPLTYLKFSWYIISCYSRLAEPFGEQQSMDLINDTFSFGKTRNVILY